MKHFYLPDPPLADHDTPCSGGGLCLGVITFNTVLWILHSLDDIRDLDRWIMVGRMRWCGEQYSSVEEQMIG